MKKTRVVVSILLIVFVCFAWMLQINGSIKDDQTYKIGIEEAAMQQEKGLYQKAIAAYERVLSTKEDPEVRKAWMEAYKLAYEDGVVSAQSYENAMVQMCQLYPNDATHWEKILRHYLDRGNYNSARNIYEECIETEAASESLTGMLREVRYAFKIKSKSYTEFTRSPAGYYTVNDGANWSTVGPTGAGISSKYYKYISPFNSALDTVYVSDTKQRLYSTSGVVEAVLKEEVLETGAYGNGVIPFKLDNDEWRFLNCSSNEFVGEGFQAVSNYTDGMAAVKKDGNWILLDAGVRMVNSAKFDNVKLHGNLDYAYEDIMIASVDGVYGIYDKNGEALNDFSCQDADVYLGGYIAYANADGKWGYVDKEGNVVIEPTFDKAKSFSNNLAAVQMDGKWGFINTRGAVVIENTFLDADYFTRNGLCMVSVADGKYRFLQLRYFE